jgi:sugar/nucleoside kinase (ribokinase family)
MQPIDYLAIGHITIDQTPTGPRLGGTAAYAALTAQALGLRAGILTAWGEELPADVLGGIPVANMGAERSTELENQIVGGVRSQRILNAAPFIEFHHIPEAWRSAPLVHLAPVAREVSPRILNYFPDTFGCATPQGWMREWDASGAVRQGEWIEAEHVLARLDACVLSWEDLGEETYRIDALAAACPALVVTKGKDGSTLFIRGEELEIPAPAILEEDPTGAGDVYAAAFFVSLYRNGDPLEAARLATQIAALSVQRSGLEGVPSRDEVQNLLQREAEAF